MKLLPVLIISFFLHACNSGADDSRDYRDDDRRSDDRGRNDDNRRKDNRDRNYTDDRNNYEPGGNDPNDNNRDRRDNRPDNNPSDERQELFALVEKFNRYVMNENWIGVVNIQYPGATGGQEKSQVAQEFATRFHNEAYDLITESATVDWLSDIFTVDGNQYAIATGKSVSVLNVKKDAFGDKRVKSNFFNNLCDSYVKDNGRQNVICDEARDYMKVTMKGVVYLLKTQEYNDWHIITKGNVENVKKYIPQSIQDRVR